MGRCDATRSDGAQCEAPAMKGGTVCRVHGGAAGQVKRVAARRVAEGEAAAALAALVPATVEPVADPFGELSRLAGEIVTARSAAAEMVGQLDSLTDPATGAARPELTLWLALIDRCSKLLGTMAKLDAGRDTGGEGGPPKFPTDRARALLAVVDEALDASNYEGRERILKALAPASTTATSERQADSRRRRWTS